MPRPTTRRAARSTRRGRPRRPRTAAMARRPPDLNDAEYQVLARFRFALRVFMRFSEEAAREAGVTPSQHQLLLAIRGGPGGAPTISDVAEWLQLRHHSTV